MSSSAAIQAAESAGFGRLLDTVPWRGAGLLGRRTPLLLHRFDAGMVVETKRGPVAFPYAEVQVFCDAEQVSKFVGAFGPDRPLYNAAVWEFTRTDQTSWGTTTSDEGTERRDPVVLACDAVLVSACRAQHGDAVARMQAGETLRFGTAVISPTELVLEPWPGIAWSAVDHFEVDAGKFAVHSRATSQLANRIAPLGIDRISLSRIANVPLFLEIAEMRRRVG